MDETKKSHPPEFYKGLDYFNRQFYYECHDVWEEIWGEAKGKEKVFYQALIMAAVSLYHFGNENLEGALSCYRKALNESRKLPDQFLGLNIGELMAKLGDFYSGMAAGQTALTADLLARPRPRIDLDDRLA
jgi:predicted metal-dependent hydrolase